MLALVLGFFVTAILYASVGFGGGSTYNALLALAGTDYRILPAIALVCNVIVVAGGAWRFHRAGAAPWRKLAPWLLASAPMAFVGGAIPISETAFVGLLGASLAFAGVRLLLQKAAPSEMPIRRAASPAVGFLAGGSIGLLSGLVGIGGGIFLAPLLYFLRWDAPRTIAGACTIFILVNSLAGLAGQLMKLNETAALAAFGGYWPLFAAALVGGQIGAFAGATRLNERVLRILTALLILYVAVRLLLRWRALIGG